MLVSVRMPVAPLPVVSLFALAGVGPVVIFLFMLFQILMPSRIFVVAPGVAVMILSDQGYGCKHRNAQYKRA